MPKQCGTKDEKSDTVNFIQSKYKHSSHTFWDILNNGQYKDRCRKKNTFALENANLNDKQFFDVLLKTRCGTVQVTLYIKLKT